MSLLSLVITGGVKLRENFQTTIYTINLTNLENLYGHINHSKMKSINNLKEKEYTKVELSLTAPIKRKVVIEKRISKTNWESLFVPIELKEVKIEIANTTSPIINENIKREVEEVSSNENLEDRISTALSASEKSLVTEVKTITKKPSISRSISNDEIEFYDYSSDRPAKKVSKLSAKIETYQLALQKAKDGNLNLAALGSRKGNAQNMPNSGNSVKPTIIDEVQGNKIIPSDIEEEKIINTEIDPKDPKTETYESDYSLSAYSVDMNKMSIQDHEGFTLEFLDSQLNNVFDDRDGIINIESKLNSSMMIRRALITSIDHYDTIIDSVFEEGSTTIPVPLIKRRAFDKLLGRSKIKGLGGHILVELDEKTEDVEIGNSTKYERKLFLNKNFKVVDRSDSEYFYIMFIGVNPGNTVLYFRTLDNQTISKIVHVTDETVYYEPNFYTEVNGDEYSVFEESLLSKDTTALSVNSKEIENFSSEYKIENLAFNRLGIKNAVYPFGTRKYQEFKHLNESIFVGRWDQKFIDLPSEEYTRFVLNQFRTNDVKGRCLVQINITKPAKSLSYNGAADRGMSIRSLILDKDGQFYDDLSFNSRKIFVLGENQGVVNVKIEYTDNSIDTLQSYCSEDTYLVEQL